MYTTHLWPFSKRKFNQKSDRVNLVAPASPIECLLYSPNVQYKLGPGRLTRLGNTNALRLPVPDHVQLKPIVRIIEILFVFNHISSFIQQLLRRTKMF